MVDWLDLELVAWKVDRTVAKKAVPKVALLVVLSAESRVVQSVA